LLVSREAVVTPVGLRSSSGHRAGLKMSSDGILVYRRPTAMGLLLAGRADTTMMTISATEVRWCALTAVTLRVPLPGLECLDDSLLWIPTIAFPLAR
jgi:hypothetical protein